MKVAYVLPYLQRPTGWRSHANAFIHAIKEHVEPVLFVSVEDYKIAQSLFPGLPLYALPVTQQASLANRRGVRALLESFRAIHSHDYPAVNLVHSMEAYPTGLVGSWLAQKCRRPHVITAHGTYGVVWHERKLDRLAYQQVLKRTGLVCPVSNGTARLMETYFGPSMARAKMRTILNGNNYGKIISRHLALERTYPRTPILLTVGDVKPRKGQAISLAAFERVKAELPEAQYRIVGYYRPENPYYRELQRFIEERQLEDVSFLGLVSDETLSRAYQEASVFLLTPQQDGLHFEGFGLVYLEAGAYGLPVVGTRTGGVPDAVREGETGLLADPEDVDGIAAALLRLLTDRELTRRMGRANREWAETLTWERFAQEQVQAYWELLASPLQPIE